MLPTKQFAIGLVISLSTVTGFAGVTDKLSKSFAGEYQLVKASGESNSGYKDKCEKHARVSISKDRVALEGSTGYTQVKFRAENAGCRNSESDVGFTGRQTCTNFRTHEVSYTSTEVITIVGFLREYTGIRLSGPNTLVYEESSTSIPFGLFVGDDSFRCVYSRLNADGTVNQDAPSLNETLTGN